MSPGEAVIARPRKSRPVHQEWPPAGVCAGEATTRPDEAGRAPKEPSGLSETASDLGVTSRLRLARLLDQQVTGWKRYGILVAGELVGGGGSRTTSGRAGATAAGGGTPCDAPAAAGGTGT